MEPVARSQAIRIGHGTHEGMSGKDNEDSYGYFSWKVDEQRVLHVGVVADGVGGQTAGELASTMAVQAVKEYFDRLPRLTDIPAHLAEAILSANAAVYNYAQQNPDVQGMGTTMVVAAILGSRLFTAYVGDSRIYRYRPGQLQQLSVDHTWAQEAIEAGLLTREQAKRHPNRNVIKRYLGGILEIEVDHRLMLKPDQNREQAEANQGVRLQKGDTILLCSDGLTDMIDDQSVLATLQRHPGLQTAVAELIDKANQAGGKDNITVVLMQMPGGVPAVPGPPVPETVEPLPVPAGGRRWILPLILTAVGLVTIVTLVGAGALLFFRGNGGGGDGPPPTPAGAEVLPTEVIPFEQQVAPATAVILLTRLQQGESDDFIATHQATPGLIPTLAALLTATPTPLPPTRTPAPTPTVQEPGYGGGFVWHDRFDQDRAERTTASNRYLWPISVTSSFTLLLVGLYLLAPWSGRVRRRLSRPKARVDLPRRKWRAALRLFLHSLLGLALWFILYRWR